MFFQQTAHTRISTTVPTKLLQDAKKKHYKHSELWLLGYQIREKNPVLDRVREVEALEEKRKMEYYALKKQYNDLKEKLEVMQNANSRRID